MSGIIGLMTLNSIHVVVLVFHARKIKGNEEERVPCYGTSDAFISQALYVITHDLYAM